MTPLLSRPVTDVPKNSDTRVEPVYVGIPSAKSLTNPESGFINVGQFDARDEVLTFARQTFGADAYGRIQLLSPDQEYGADYPLPESAQTNSPQPEHADQLPRTGIFTRTNRRTLRTIQQKLVDLRTELATLAQREGERLSLKNEFTRTGEFHNRAIGYLDEGHVLDAAIEQIEAAIQAEQKQTIYA